MKIQVIIELKNVKCDSLAIMSAIESVLEPVADNVKVEELVVLYEPDGSRKTRLEPLCKQNQPTAARQKGVNL